LTEPVTSENKTSLHVPIGRLDSLTSAWYPEALFGGFTAKDGTIAFYTRVNALLSSDSVVIDFGCGRGRTAGDSIPFRRKLQCLKGKVANVIGIDVKDAGRLNNSIDEFRLLHDAAPWPVANESVNLILADNVIEHLADPPWFFSEARRVLRRGGYICARTPNCFGYVALISRIAPERLHSGLLAKAQPDRADCDIFPTLYRCNTPRSWRRAFERNGFAGVVQVHESEPRYLRFSRWAYAAGVGYQRLAPSAVRNVIFAFGRKIDQCPEPEIR
jgi:SAM-dependent methyltransferase